MATYSVSGLSLKFWRTVTTYQAEDPVFTEETCTFILPDYTDSDLFILKNLITNVTKIASIFPDLNAICDLPATVEIKPELNLKQELEEIEQTQRAAAEEAVKIEHDTINTIIKQEVQDFIDDDDLDEELHTWSLKKKRRSTKKSKSSSRKLCLKCGETFSMRKKLRAHLKECNPEQLESDKNGLPKNKGRKGHHGQFKCKQCLRFFNKLSTYEIHMNAHKLSAIIKEGKIETSVDDKSAVFDNKLMKSRETFQLQNWCEQCDLAYSNHQMYKQHMDHFHKRSISCPECDLKFTYEKSLLKHKLDYHTLYPKQCNQCSQLFLTAKSLYEHIDVHTKHINPKNSPCEICGKLLKDKYTLKAHVEAVHEKRAGGDFACEQCGKMLKSKSSLSYHRKSAHTQDFPHRCDVCGKGFIKYNRMVNCLNNHQGIYKYRCPECDYKTNKLIQFKEHVNMHTGEKSYFCPVCRHKSNGTKNLGCHIKQVHKMTLCQAEVTYRTNRFGEPMTEDQIEDMRVRMSSLSNYNEKIVQGLKASADSALEQSDSVSNNQISINHN